ncbi:MAG: sulfur carrier protein ThiS [Planctomycetes bacterium]|nr:sulfur carrier protein ThiS [Planctomycetota bacterium]
MAVLKINGKEKDFDGSLPATLSELLIELKVDAATVVAEVDGEIIEREKFGSFSLKEGQSIELVRFVPGG